MTERIEIRNSKGEVDLHETAWMIFGPPKIGKSKFASGWPHVIYLVTSKKEIARIKAPYILVNTHKKLMAAVDYLIENKKVLDHRVVVFDFVDAMYSNAETYICQKLKIEHPSEAGYGKGVGMIDKAFGKVINQMIGSGYGCIFISHMQIKEVTTIGGTVTKTVTSLPERARKILIPLVSVIGYIDFESVKKKDEETGKVKFIQQRMISFEPSEFLEAGDRDGYLPPKIRCFEDPKKTYQVIEDYYSGKKTK